MNARPALEMPYMAVIPFAVLSDEDLSPAAKIFFGCLAGLAKREGYCYADNDQLAEMQKVDRRQISRWLLQLERKGFVRRETVNRPYRDDEERFLWRKERKIYVSDGFSNNSTDKDINVPTNDRDKNVPINEKDKNVPSNNKSPKSKSSKREMSQPASAALRLAALLFELIRKNDPKARKPNLDKWAEDIDKLLRLDGRSEEEVERVIRWSLADDFWCRNILSGRKLREKFDQLFVSVTKHKESPTKVAEDEAKQKAERIRKNKQWAAEFLGKAEFGDHRNRMALRDNGVEISYNGGYSIVSFLEHGFKDQVYGTYRKIKG